MGKKIFLICVILLIVLSACGPSAEVITLTIVAEMDHAATLAVPTATATPAATSTATATNTPAPTKTPTSTLEPSATPEPDYDRVSEIGQDYGMTLYVMSGRWGLVFDDGSAISLVAQSGAYVITWSAPRAGEIQWDANAIANRILTLVNALEFPESMFQNIVNDLVLDWNEYLKSPNYEELYAHDGYEITIYEDETSTAFDPNHPFNEGGFHIVLSMEKVE